MKLVVFSANLVNRLLCRWNYVLQFMTEEIRYKLLKILEQNPDISQRELSKQLGISLGKVNYCVQALKDKG